jgi:CHAT domain-containing protein/tetratricopeptide (TPR) repeat protein
LAALLAQLRALPATPPARPRRISLCRRALDELSREARPQLWARLHAELGLCHLQAARSTPSAPDPAPDLQQAVHHYHQALQVYTPARQPDAWLAARHNLALAYHRWGREEDAIRAHCETLELAGPPATIALLHDELALWYAARRAGDRVENGEAALSHARRALRAWCARRDPLHLARVQDLLGTLHRNRWQGDPAQNLEKALCRHRVALLLLTALERPAPPSDRARVQHNLGTTWFHRVRGDRRQNIEAAIRHLEAALTLRLRHALPSETAETRYNLALAYIERQQGDGAENVQHAITLLQAVAAVHTRQAFPVEWAKTRRALGDAALRRERGDRTQGVEQALQDYMAALDVLEGAGRPGELALTRHNLAVAYSERQRGDPARNLRRALACGLGAWRSVDLRDLLRWALIRTDLVDLYWKLARHLRAQDPARAARYLERAIAHGEAVVARLDAWPPSHRWALAHYNLGNAYGDRLAGERADNQELALSHYHQALEVYTPGHYPARWADTHNNLAVTYWERVEGDPAANRARALHHFQQARQVFKPGTFPTHSRRLERNRGHLCFELGRWEQAAAAYRDALSAGDLLYRAAATPQARRAELAQVRDLPARLAFALAQHARGPGPELVEGACPELVEGVREAVVALETHRARWLNEALALQRDRPAAVPADAWDAFVAARQAVQGWLSVARRAAPSTGPGDGVADQERFLALSQGLQAARAQLDAAITRVQRYQPDFMPAPDFAAIQAAAMPGTPVAYLNVTPAGALGLVVTAQNSDFSKKSEFFTPLTEEKLASLLVQGETQPPAGYLPAQFGLAPMDAALAGLLPVLGRALIAPLAHQLHELDAQGVVLIPGGLLALLPLHAAPYRRDGRTICLLDHFDVAYAPSARVLSSARRALAARATAPPVLAGVGNPLDHPEPLDYARAELEAVAALFPDRPPARRTLVEHAATRAALEQALPGASYVHLACHGLFNPGQPLDSHLQLADGETYTLRAVLDAGSFDAARLVALSACQTAITDFQHLPDETLGLPAGFLQAGVPGVVGTLWPVDDLSTALLMARFYALLRPGDPDAEHHEDRLPPARALRRAQCWLRDVTAGQLLEHLQRERAAGRIPETLAAQGVSRFAWEDDAVRPFAGPEHWAPFIFVGV